MSLARCHVHGGNPLDTQLLHEHHAVPRASGGGDQRSNLVWLCPNCHDLLHKVVHKITSSKHGIAQDLIGQYLPTQPAARERLESLVEIAAKSQKDHVPSIEEDGDDTVVMQLHIPMRIHGRLKTLAVDQKIGLYRYTLAVLEKHTQVATDPYLNPAAKFGGPAEERPTIDPVPLIKRYGS